MTTKELIEQLQAADPEGTHEAFGATGGKIQFGPTRTELIHSVFARRTDGAVIVMLEN